MRRIEWLAIAWLFALSLHAEWTGWKQAGGSTVEVPAGQTVSIYDDDVPYVRNLGKIVIGAGAKVFCANQDAYLTISAPISGSGEFHVDNESSAQTCGVTLLGDNSKLVSPGFFSIVNANVAVSNECGLGGVETAAIRIRYDEPASGTLAFGLAGKVVFTNAVPIRMTTVSGDDVCWRLGSQADGETLVQTGDVTISEVGTGARSFGCAGDLVLDCKIAIEKGTDLVFDSSGAVLFGDRCRFSQLEGKRLSLHHTGASHPGDEGTPWYSWNASERPTAIGEVSLAVAGVRLERDGQFGLPSDPDLPDFTYDPSVGENEASLTRLDLNGHDAAFVQFSSARDADIKSGDTNLWCDVLSAAPANLTCAATNQCRREALRFRGSAGWAHTGSGTNLLVNCASDSGGPFIVTGGCSGLDSGATWGGTNVTVTGGILWIGERSSSAGAFGKETSHADVRLSSGGKIFIEGGEVVVHRVLVDGVQMRAGTYGSASAPAEGVTPVAWIDGKGTLRVMRSYSGMAVFVSR